MRLFDARLLQSHFVKPGKFKRTDYSHLFIALGLARNYGEGLIIIYFVCLVV